MRSELFIGGYAIDCIDSIDVEITKEIYSIVDPSKTKSDYTKTVTIAGSKGNDFVFRALFDVNFEITNDGQLEPFFNPTKKAECIYLVDTLTQIEGYCQLKEIVILKENKVSYNIVIYGKKRDFFSKISTKTLNDLTTLGNSSYNDTTIRDNWAASGVVDYSGDELFYPLINKDMFVGGAGGLVAYNWDSFKPFISVKRLVKAIINESGFSYQSSFIDSDYFKKLILQCSVEKFTINQSVINSNIVDVQRTASQTITLVTNSNTGSLANYWNKNVAYNIEITDPNNQFSTVTNTFTAGSTNWGSINIQCNGYVLNSATLTAATGQLSVMLIRKRGSTYTMIKSGIATNVSTGGLAGTRTIMDISINVNSISFAQGDEFRVCIGNMVFNGTQNNTNWSWTNYDGLGSLRTNTFYETLAGRIPYGGIVDHAQIQYNILQKDFLMGIVKMFNLYIEAADDGTLIIEPRDDYFTNDVIDWSTKLDNSKDFKIQPIGLLENKKLEFNYAKGIDYLSNSFYEDTGYIHGFREVEFDNDFVKDIKKIDIPFTLPPMRNFIAGVKMELTKYDRTENVESTPKPIIAFYDGMVSGTVWYYLDTTGTVNTYNSYPYAGHLDNPLNPTYDLAFSRMPIYYFTTPNTGGLKLPNYNLWSQFHYRQWTETSDKNSKLVECYIKINPFDIATLSFRKLYFIKNAYYRLLEIQDYDPKYKSTTLCKFLKINLASPISNGTTQTEGQDGNTGGKNIGNGGSIKDNVKVGTESNIDEKSRGVVILNRDNVVSGGGGILTNGYGNNFDNVQGVLVVNSNNNNVVKSNTLILGFNYVNLIADYTVVGNEGSPLYLICDNDLAGGNITVTLPQDTDNNGKLYVITKTKLPHQVIIKDDDGTTLETLTSIGSVEYLITEQWQKVK